MNSTSLYPRAPYTRASVGSECEAYPACHSGGAAVHQVDGRDLCAYHSPYDVAPAPDMVTLWDVIITRADTLTPLTRSTLRYDNLSDANEAAQVINGSDGPNFATIQMRRIPRLVPFLV